VTKEERLKKMMVGSYLPEHSKVAAEVLEKLKEVGAKRGLVISDDIYWPYHVLASGPNLGQLVSLFWGGFRKYIEVQVLTSKGLADHRYGEESFSTPMGAINYVLRLQDKWRNPKR